MIEPRIVEYIKQTPDRIFSSVWIKKNSQIMKDENSYFPRAKIGNYLILSGKNEVLLNSILEMIKSAKQMICICSFIFAEEKIKEALIQASKKGIHIYILTATDKFLRNLPDEDKEFDKITYKQSVELFKDLKDKSKIRTADHFHSKFIIIDPKNDEKKKGILLTANLTTKALTKNPEVAIILSNIEIDDLFVHFCNGFWLESHYDYLDNEFRPKLEFKEYFEGSIKNLLITSSTKNTLLNKLTEIINEASKRIVISTFGILDDNEIFDLLLKKLKMGVEVVILTRPREKTMRSLLKLKKAGAKIFGHPLIHAKICMAISNDFINPIMMTANFEELGLDTGFETGVLINDDRKNSIEKVLNKWIAHFPFKLETYLSLKDLNGLIINWNGETGVLEEYSIIESKEITLKDKISKNFQDFVEYQIQDDDYHIDNTGKEIFLKYIIKRIILPPLLPKNSREINFDSLEKETKKLLKNTSLKIYKKDKKNYIVISNLKELTQAEKIAKKLHADIVSHLN